MKYPALFAAAALAAFALVGCNQSPEGGSPGTTASFKLSAPTMSTDIKQGDRQTVTVSVNRDKDFKQNVKLSADAPKGLKANFEDSDIAASDPADAKLTITADQDAALGDHVVKVTGKPDSGAATSVDVKVTVKAK